MELGVVPEDFSLRYLGGSAYCIGDAYFLNIFTGCLISEGTYFNICPTLKKMCRIYLLLTA